MTHDLMVQMVDYLSVSNPRIGGDDPDEQENIVCITIRPDSGSYRPHNIGLSKTQAQRLLLDLKRLLTATSLLLLLFTAGCSARVQVIQEPSASAKSTVVEVDLLTKPEVRETQPRKLIEATEVHGDVVNVAGDLHLHRHFHFHDQPTPEPVQVEEERFGNDEVCELLRLEHEARVRKWWAAMGR